MNARELLDPTSELRPVRWERAPRPTSLEGLTVGLLDISKSRGDVFLDRLAELLTARGIAVTRFTKPTFTKVLPPGLRGQIVMDADVVIEGLAD